MIGFIDTLNTPFGTIGNYSSIGNPHTLQTTAAPAKHFQPAVFISRILATDL
jgi:hypothetical protein